MDVLLHLPKLPTHRITLPAGVYGLKQNRVVLAPIIPSLTYEGIAWIAMKAWFAADAERAKHLTQVDGFWEWLNPCIPESRLVLIKRFNQGYTRDAGWARDADHLFVRGDILVDMETISQAKMRLMKFR